MVDAMSLPDGVGKDEALSLMALLACLFPQEVEHLFTGIVGTGACSTAESADPESESAWREIILKEHLRRPHRRNIIDDGFFSSMAQGATFSSLWDFPVIEEVDPDVIPRRAVPFSKIDQAEQGDCCVFFEKGPMFADYLVYRELREQAQKKISLFAPADCSVYTDMPFALQPASIYMSRLTAHDLQQQGKLHAPLCRWGDERTYRPYISDVPIAFIGLPKHNAVWVGTYGLSLRRADRVHLHNGLVEMLKWLEPRRVFVYGPTPKSVFGDLWGRTDFVVYPNWMKLKHGGENYGQR